MPSTSSALVTDKTRPLMRVGGVPRVEGHGSLGVLGELMRDQFVALRRWQRDYGGVFELRLGPASFVIAADANAASEMLIEGGQRFVRGGALYSPMYPMFGTQSMLTSEGDVWRSRRRGAQPHFRQRAIAALAERVDRKIVQVLQQLQPGEQDVYRFGGRVSMAVALEVMFGYDLDPTLSEQLTHAIDYGLTRIGVGWLTSRLPRWIPIPGRRRLHRELAVIDECITTMVRARLSTGDYGDDFLGMLLSMADNGDLAPEHIRGECVALISAGYDTTANALGWALWELSRRPEMLARVREEADEALQSGVPRDPKALSFARQVFMETMRMYPSAIWIPRSTAEDTTLAGYPIAAGTPVLCSAYLVHHDPHAWDEPERFDPERFADGSPPSRSRHAFMPFGLGQHMCIGQHLALLEGPLLLARFIQHWDLEPKPGFEARAKISTTMTAKGGVWLDLRPRPRP